MMPLLMLTACTFATSAPPTPGPTPGPAPAPGPAPEPAEPGEPALQGTTGPTEAPARGVGVATLQDVRAMVGKRHERVAFELSELPGYKISYVTEMTQCGSGEPVKVPGQAWLQVQLQPAAAHTEAGQATVSFREKAIDQPIVKALQSTCDYEADVTWVIGLAKQVPYAVTESKDPPRLVIHLLP
jgi:hypothetical protein